MSIGNKIKAAREGVGMSKVELAGKMGISSRQVWLWEKSTSNPSVETLGRISEALGCELTVLFTGSDEKVVVLRKDTLDQLNQKLI